MDIKVANYFKSIENKNVAFCGIARTNLPLTQLYSKYGAKVVALDKKEREAFLNILPVLESANVKTKFGENYLENLDCEIFFRTPAFYYNSKEIQDIIKSGVQVTSEIETFFDVCPAKIFAITGSDGKTTTTSIIAAILEKTNKNVFLGGNIGKPLLPRIEEIESEDFAVAELSSFQLISMKKSPQVAVITNVSPNHLDVHETMEEYIQSKLNILNYQAEDDVLVLNEDNEITRGFKSLCKGELRTFSVKEKVENGAYCDQKGDIFIVENGEETFILNKSEIFIKGEHNVENFLAAFSATFDQVDVKDLIEVAKTFSGVEHRIEFVRNVDGVDYYNDSIATSPTRTIAGLKAFGKKIILIAGGYDKKIPHAPMAPFVNEFVKILILMGDTASKIEESVKNDTTYNKDLKIIYVDSMEEAVKVARENAVAGDVVSLSPAAAAFDKYKDFEERGRHYKTIVKELK